LDDDPEDDDEDDPDLRFRGTRTSLRGVDSARYIAAAHAAKRRRQGPARQTTERATETVQAAQAAASAPTRGGRLGEAHGGCWAAAAVVCSGDASVQDERLNATGMAAASRGREATKGGIAKLRGIGALNAAAMAGAKARAMGGEAAPFSTAEAASDRLDKEAAAAAGPAPFIAAPLDDDPEDDDENDPDLRFRSVQDGGAATTTAPPIVLGPVKHRLVEVLPEHWQLQQVNEDWSPPEGEPPLKVGPFQLSVTLPADSSASLSTFNFNAVANGLCTAVDRGDAGDLWHEFHLFGKDDGKCRSWKRHGEHGMGFVDVMSALGRELNRRGLLDVDAPVAVPAGPTHDEEAKEEARVATVASGRAKLRNGVQRLSAASAFNDEAVEGATKRAAAAAAASGRAKLRNGVQRLSAVSAFNDEAVEGATKRAAAAAAASGRAKLRNGVQRLSAVSAFNDEAVEGATKRAAAAAAASGRAKLRNGVQRLSAVSAFNDEAVEGATKRAAAAAAAAAAASGRAKARGTHLKLKALSALDEAGAMWRKSEEDELAEMIDDALDDFDREDPDAQTRVVCKAPDFGKRNSVGVPGGGAAVVGSCSECINFYDPDTYTLCPDPPVCMATGLPGQCLAWTAELDALFNDPELNALLDDDDDWGPANLESKEEAPRLGPDDPMIAELDAELFGEDGGDSGDNDDDDDDFDPAELESKEEALRLSPDDPMIIDQDIATCASRDKLWCPHTFGLRGPDGVLIGWDPHVDPLTGSCVEDCERGCPPAPWTPGAFEQGGRRSGYERIVHSETGACAPVPAEFERATRECEKRYEDPAAVCRSLPANQRFREQARVELHSTMCPQTDCGALVIDHDLVRIGADKRCGPTWSGAPGGIWYNGAHYRYRTENSPFFWRDAKAKTWQGVEQEVREEGRAMGPVYGMHCSSGWWDYYFPSTCSPPEPGRDFGNLRNVGPGWLSLVRECVLETYNEEQEEAWDERHGSDDDDDPMEDDPMEDDPMEDDPMEDDGEDDPMQVVEDAYDDPVSNDDVAQGFFTR
jgi:hypothetical protein